MDFKDYFSKQAEIYSKARPGYPDELFSYLSSLCKEHKLVWDCATGNGQAASSLTKYFASVIATDASEQQLSYAVKHERITYKIAFAEVSGLENESVDLISVANAFHWFDAERFYKEANRVLKPEGIFAIWSYAKSHVGGPDKDKINIILEQFARGFLKDYWPPENKMVVNGYKDVHLPFEEIKAPDFNCVTRVNLDKVLGFMYSWSSTQRYIKETGNDPIEHVKRELLTIWGDPNEHRPMAWELALKVGRK
jgi:ubiquinone/menaquinone biosynthesis C-methylase UbiE